MISSIGFTDKVINLAIKELCDGKTFYDGYFNGGNWNLLNRADRALILLGLLTGSSALGIPHQDTIPPRIKKIINDMITLNKLEELKNEQK